MWDQQALKKTPPMSMEQLAGNTDASSFMESATPWFARGGANVGIFNFGYSDGTSYNRMSFRLVHVSNY